MSSLVHLGRAAMTRAQLEAPREREAAHGTLVPARGPDRPARTAADVMTRLPATVHRSTSMWTAWGRLHGARTQHLVVVDDHQRPAGVLDQQTMALEWPPGPLGAHWTPVFTLLLRGRARPRVRSRDDVATVARTMLDARADAVPVVDEAGRLLGLVTLWHFAALAADGGRGEPPRRSTARPTGRG
ncbi:HPP family protein [Geodermatophilus sp. SYSU D00703]